MTAPKFPRRRAPHHKVSTGCYSCKKRRIKCDEARPICKRCLTSGFDCTFPAATTSTGSRVTSALSQPLAKSSQHNIPIPSAPSGEPKLTQTEALYFDFFRSSVIHDLATHSYSPLDLTRTILRECARDDAVRSSVISIGALALANRSPRPSTDVYNLAKINHTAWRHALTHHTRAISIFRNQLTSPTLSLSSSAHSLPSSNNNNTTTAPPPRSILILSTLFILFELAQGNTAAVDTLTSSTLSALSKPLNLTADTTSASLIPGSRSCDDDEGIKGLENLFFLSATYTAFALPSYTAQTRLISTLDIGPLRSAVSLDGWETRRERVLGLRDAMTEWEAFVGRVTLWGVRCWSIVTRTGRDIEDPRTRDAQQRFLAQISEWNVIIHDSMAREREEQARYSAAAATVGGGGHGEVSRGASGEASLAWLELLYAVNVLYAFTASCLSASECRYDPYVERYRVGVDMVEERIMAIVVRQQQEHVAAAVRRSESASSSVAVTNPARGAPAAAAGGGGNGGGQAQSQGPSAPGPGPGLEPGNTTSTGSNPDREIPIRSSSSPTRASSKLHSPQPTAEEQRHRSEKRNDEIPTQSFPMPVLNSRLLQSLCVSLRACRDHSIRLRLLALCKIVVNQGSTWDDKATYIGSKVLVDLEEARRLVVMPQTRLPYLGTNDEAALGIKSGAGGASEFIHGNVSAGAAAPDSTRATGGSPDGMELDLTTSGLPEALRLRWEHAEWAPDRAGLKLVFLYPTSGETVVVNTDRTGEYGYLMC